MVLRDMGRRAEAGPRRVEGVHVPRQRSQGAHARALLKSKKLLKKGVFRPFCGKNCELRPIY